MNNTDCKDRVSTNWSNDKTLPNCGNNVTPEDFAVSSPQELIQYIKKTKQCNTCKACCDDCCAHRWILWLESQKPSDEAIEYFKLHHSSSEVSEFQAAMNIAVLKAYDAGKNSMDQSEFQRFLTSVQGSKPMESWQEEELSEDEEIADEIVKYISMQITLPDDKYSRSDMIDWIKSQKESSDPNFSKNENDKSDFVNGRIVECRKSFDEFEEHEQYQLSYIGNDHYIGVSDNIRNKRFYIPPRDLYSCFTEISEEPVSYAPGKYEQECLSRAARRFYSVIDGESGVTDLFHTGVECGKVLARIGSKDENRCEVKCNNPVEKPNGCITMEDFTDGDGYYRMMLEYLSQKQLQQIEEIVCNWSGIPSMPDLEYERGYTDGWDSGTRSVIDSLNKIDLDKEYWRGYNEGAKSVYEKYASTLQQALDEVKTGNWILSDNDRGYLELADVIINDAKGKLEGYQTDDGVYECECASTVIKGILGKVKKEVQVSPKEQAESTDTKTETETEHTLMWTEKDREKIDEIIIDATGGYRLENDQIEWLKSLRDKTAVVEEPNHSWSEEDETFFRTVKKFLFESEDISDGTYNKCIEWLRNMQNRIVPDTEWTEKDEQILERLINEYKMLLDEADKKEFGDQLAPIYQESLLWLTSLSPNKRERWDEGDLQHIQNAMECAEMHGYTGTANWLDSLSVSFRRGCDRDGVPSKQMIYAIWQLGKRWEKETEEFTCDTASQDDYIRKHWKESTYYENLKPASDEKATKVYWKKYPKDTNIDPMAVVLFSNGDIGRATMAFEDCYVLETEDMLKLPKEE